MGSIPDEVIGFFNWSNTSSHTMALGLTQLLTEMRTRNLPGGKVCPRLRLTTPLTSVSRLSRKYGSLDISQYYGPSGPVTGIALPSTLHHKIGHFSDDGSVSKLLAKLTCSMVDRNQHSERNLLPLSSGQKKTQAADSQNVKLLFTRVHGITFHDVKSKLPLCFIKHHVMMIHGAVAY
jgi:hypothetical protein